MLFTKQRTTAVAAVHLHGVSGDNKQATSVDWRTPDSDIQMSRADCVNVVSAVTSSSESHIGSIRSVGRQITFLSKGSFE